MEEMIKNSLSINEVAMKMFGYSNGRTYRKIKKYIDSNNIDISHFPDDPRRYKLTKYPRIKKECPVCGKQFETMLGHRDEKIVCSYSCSNTYFRSGVSNPNYKNDRELIGKAKYVKICFRYHKKKCVCCNETNVVEVHHYDGNKNNNDPENLIPLCPTHHQYWHSKFRNLIKDVVDKYKEEYKLIGV
jgi:hypothetical protein